LMILPIRKYGDKILRKKAKKIEVIDKDILSMIDDMIETMHNADGVGLAANQIGLAIQLAVIDPLIEEEDHEPSVFINPKIISRDGEEIIMEEGCLSLPEIREEIKRPEKITVRAMDKYGNDFEEEYDDLVARVLQHEIDHLNGILFIDHLSTIKRQLLRKDLREIAKGEKV